MFRSIIYTSLLLTSTLTTALPTTLSSSSSSSSSRNFTTAELNDPTTSFYLVTTSTPSKSYSAAALPDVSALTLFDPFYVSSYNLRTIAPGYNGLPTFNLTNGQLHSLTEGPHGIADFIYNSTGLTQAGTLDFEADIAESGQGQLELLDGYLLNVIGLGSNNSGVGWSVCEGDLEESVIYWQGDQTGCKSVFIQAVTEPPY